MKKYNLKIEGEPFNVTVESFHDKNAVISVNGKTFNVVIESQDSPQAEEVISTRPVRTEPAKAISKSNAYKVKSPLPGLILDIKVKEGDSVKEGQVVAVIEAMKMENDIEAERSGIVKSIGVAKGETVLEGTTLLVIE